MAQQNENKLVSPAEIQHFFVLPILKPPLKKMTENQLRHFIPNMLTYSMGRGEFNWNDDLQKPPWWPSDVEWANILTDDKSFNSIQTTNYRMDALQKVIISCYKYHQQEDLLSTTDEFNVHNCDTPDNMNPLSIVDRTTEFNSICRLCLGKATSAVVDIFSFYDDEEIASIVSQHFWFQIFKGDGQSDRLCTNCWIAVKDFQKFFKEVQQIHNSLPETFARIPQIKEEPPENINDVASETEMEVKTTNITYEVMDSISSTPNIAKLFETATVDMMLDNNEDYLTEEMDKQRRKLRDIGNVLDNQHQLLRLIIQKMEIKTEADDVDEGVAPNNDFSSRSTAACMPQSTRWNSPLIRKKLKHAMSFNKN